MGCVISYSVFGVNRSRRTEWKYNVDVNRVISTLMNKLIWQGRPVLKDADYDQLETDAALKEFGEGKPRSHAEEESYQTYKRNQHLAAAAHHLRGMRAAQATGDLDEARLHGELYHRHMGELGFDSADQVPDEVKALVEHEGKAKQYKFKAHGADQFIMPSEQKEED